MTTAHLDQAVRSPAKYSKHMPNYYSGCVTNCPGTTTTHDQLVVGLRHQTFRDRDIHQTFRDNEVTDGMEITAMVSRVSWGWRFKTAFQRHFPVCYSCMKMATDAHLAGKGHQERTRSIQQRIDFPGRERFCMDGVQFRELGTDGKPGALITTQWLHATHHTPHTCTHQATCHVPGKLIHVTHHTN